MTGAIAAVAAIGGVAFWSIHRGAFAPSSPASTAALVVVETTRVAIEKLPQALTAAASLRAERTITIRTEAAGRIAAILFKDGDSVAKGAVLVRLDDAARKAELQRARSTFRSARSSYDRAIDLRDKGFLSSESLDESQHDLESAHANVKRMEVRLAKMTIHAPVAGTVQARVVNVGDSASEGQAIATLEPFDALLADFRFPESASGFVHTGQRLRIETNALPDRAYEGRLLAIERHDEANASFLFLRVRVRNRDGRLRPGMPARVHIATGGSADALVVPEQSIFAEGNDEYVYKVIDGKAVRRKVDTGQRRERRIEILGGLAANDVIVAAARGTLRDGAPVVVAPAAGR